MKIESFGKIEYDTLYAEHYTFTNDNRVWCHPISLYDRIRFTDDFAIKKYICIYEDSPTLMPRDTIDKAAYVIFERTINPDLDPRMYVCIKIGDEMRENLR